MNEYKVIIAGGRNFSDYTLLKEKCDFYLQQVYLLDYANSCANTHPFRGGSMSRKELEPRELYEGIDEDTKQADGFTVYSF